MVNLQFWKKNNVTVNLPTALTEYTKGNKEISVEANTVYDAIKNTIKQNEKLREHILDGNWKLRDHINVYLGNQNIKELETKINPGDKLTLVYEFSDVSLSAKEKERYARHILLPEVGKAGQEKIKNSKILIIGIGGLGSPASLYLAASGVGTLGLVDFDKVEKHNLHRQIIYNTKSVGKQKILAAKKTLQELNSDIKINTYSKPLTSQNALEIIKDYDLVIDCTDNIPSRYLINDACSILNKPFIYGSIFKFDGQVSVFNQNNSACYRCLFPKPPQPGMIPTCNEAGVLGVLPGVIGLIQATEALKIVLGIGTTLSNRLMIYDALNMKFEDVQINKNPSCPTCNKTLHKLLDYDEFCGIKNHVSQNSDDITVQEVQSMFKKKEDFIIVDVREKSEYDLGNIKQAINIPLSNISKFKFGDLEKVNKNKPIILHCRSGSRSKQALQVLKTKGYKNVKSLSGGIKAWADEVDQSIDVA